jgi:predicted O-methyltransferase YrrM
MMFTEEWISGEALAEIRALVRSVEDVAGAIIEFGCWEGRSFVQIAEAAGEREVHAVDHWEGNVGDQHTTDAVATRDVYGTFLSNTAHLGNVMVHRMSTERFMRDWNEPIAFIHLDADHNYQPVKDQISWALTLLSPGGVICGDDYSHRWKGVIQAVDELLPECQIVSCMWIHADDR